MNAEQITQMLRQYAFRPCTESELQASIARLLTAAKVEFEREVRLDAKDRPDFLCAGGIAIEVKVGGSSAALLRQCHRYAQHDTVAEVIAITTKPWHHLPETLNGKLISLLVLNTGGL